MARYDEDTANPVNEKDYYGTQAQQGVVGGKATPQAYDEYAIEQLFTYHPANPFVAPKYDAIREAAKYFAKVLYNNVPQGADRTAAIRKLREAVMTANAGIALGGLSL
jgi:hypothetical protein